MVQKNPSQNYVVLWRWAEADPQERLKRDEVQATDALRAANKVIKALSEEYADVRKNIKIMSVELQD